MVAVFAMSHVDDDDGRSEDFGKLIRWCTVSRILSGGKKLFGCFRDFGSDNDNERNDGRQGAIVVSAILLLTLTLTFVFVFSSSGRTGSSIIRQSRHSFRVESPPATESTRVKTYTKLK